MSQETQKYMPKQEQRVHPQSYQELLRSVEMPELDAGLYDQINNYLKAFQRLDRERGIAEDQERVRELAMLYFKLTQFVFSRNHRIDEIKSEKVQEAIETKKNLFPYSIPKLMLCVDGRVLSKLFAGLHGNALRTPAGDSEEFMPKRKGNGLFLNTEGQTAKVIEEELIKNDVVCEVLDSHIGCAARAGKMKEKLGHDVPDHGLSEDVRRKKEMAEALKNYVAEKYHNKKKVVPIQATFDPHSGFMFMGLEQNSCLEEDTRVKKDGYTKEVLTTLANENKIISTENLMETKLKDIFQKNYFEINYETDYINSTYKFWKNIQIMGEEALKPVKEKLIEVFGRKIEEKELGERALLLLANAYNGYLHNHDDQGNKRDYPYGEHDESVIVATYSEKGPFDRARSFSVNPTNFDLSGDISLTRGLIQNNRRAGRMSNTEKNAVNKLYGEKTEQYVDNPVPTIFFERLKVTPNEQVIKKLRETDWSDLPERDWMSMSQEEFEDYLEEKIPNIPNSVVNMISALRKSAIELYKPGKKSTEMLLDGRVVPVWTLTGPDRKTIALFPFMAKGY